MCTCTLRVCLLHDMYMYTHWNMYKHHTCSYLAPCASASISFSVLLYVCRVKKKWATRLLCSWNARRTRLCDDDDDERRREDKLDKKKEKRPTIITTATQTGIKFSKKIMSFGCCSFNEVEASNACQISNGELIDEKLVSETFFILSY